MIRIAAALLMAGIVATAQAQQNDEELRLLGHWLEPGKTEADTNFKVKGCLRVFDGNPAQRGICLDSAYVAAKPADTPPSASSSGPKKIASQFSLSSDATVTGIDVAPGSDPATLSFSRDSGKTGSQVQFGAIYRAFFPNFPDFSPLVGLAVDRDTTSADRTDVRQLILGATYNMPARQVDGHSAPHFVFEIQGRERRDYETGSNSTLGILQANWYDYNWQGSAHGPFSHFLVPYVGFSRVDARNATTDFGATRSFFYAGFLYTYFAKGILEDRLSFNLSGKISRDTTVASEFSRQTYRTFKVGASYQLTSASDGQVVPVLTISREVGNDLITGVNGRNKTQLGLGLSVNLP